MKIPHDCFLARAIFGSPMPRMIGRQLWRWARRRKPRRCYAFPGSSPEVGEYLYNLSERATLLLVGTVRNRRAVNVPYDGRGGAWVLFDVRGRDGRALTCIVRDAETAPEDGMLCAVPVEIGADGSLWEAFPSAEGSR